ncbi:YfbU family protein [Sphingobium mellinum]|uniref:YfbU family protein n=1 Tax=Sphingobium mellinum TaxID=1387166 RepID=UPI0030ED13E0
MKMSDGERLILVMLAEVMEALKLDREIDPSLVKSLVINNDGWALARKYPGIFESQAPSDEVVSETTNILWMWGIIESSIQKLSGAEADEAKTWHWTAFAGFDANNDPHYGVAQTMIQDLEEFSTSRKGVNLNSHSQTSLPRYRQMFAKFDGYVKASQASPLSFAALRDLCS